VELSVALSSKHCSTIYSEHSISTYSPLVIMETSEYARKMQSILENRLTFTLIENDWMLANGNRLIPTLLWVRRKKQVGFICNDEYNMARLFGASAACL
jgi:hypothetical protein